MRGARKVGEVVTCLTVLEVAERLGLGRNAVYRLIAAGELPHVRLGARTIRVRTADLSDYLLGHVRRGEADGLAAAAAGEETPP